jgi:hypothetical protein
MSKSTKDLLLDVFIEVLSEEYEDNTVPKEPREGDWICRKCNLVRFSYCKFCADCGSTKTKTKL